MQRRVARNMRQAETGHRSPLGRGRFRGLTPIAKAEAMGQHRAAMQRALEAKMAREKSK